MRRRRLAICAGDPDRDLLGLPRHQTETAYYDPVPGKIRSVVAIPLCERNGVVHRTRDPGQQDTVVGIHPEKRFVRRLVQERCRIEAGHEAVRQAEPAGREIPGPQRSIVPRVQFVQHHFREIVLGPGQAEKRQPVTSAVGECVPQGNPEQVHLRIEFPAFPGSQPSVDLGGDIPRTVCSHGCDQRHQHGDRAKKRGDRLQCAPSCRTA